MYAPLPLPRSLLRRSVKDVKRWCQQPHYPQVSRLAEGWAVGLTGEAGTAQVHGFRMSLWREQLGALEPLFESPEELPCVQRVQQLAQVGHPLGFYVGLIHPA